MALRSTDDTANGQGPPARPTVAAFDFDGTLADGGSVFPFLVSVRGLLPVLGATLRLSPGLVRAAITGGTAADEVKEKLFKALNAFLEPIRARREQFASKPEHVREIIVEGTRKGRAVAQETMAEVRAAMKISYKF